MFKKLTFTLLFLPFFFIFPKLSFASTLYLTPNSGNISVGSTKVLQVRFSAGSDAVNAVAFNLTYPADKLSVAYINGGSAFSIAAEDSRASGTMRIVRGNINPVTGDVLVATIGFKGIGAGLATLAFTGGSAAPRASDSTDSLNLAGSRGGTYNVVSGAVLASSAQGAPVNTLPVAGAFDTTVILSIIGVSLTFLGAVGLILL